MFHKQVELDYSRRTYVITFPSDLAQDRVTAWLNAISGALNAKNRAIAMPTLVFETLATGTGIQHRIRIPRSDASFVVSHLESLIPGTHVEEVKEPMTTKWTIGVELHMSNPSRQLRIDDASNFSASVLTSIQSLREDEQVLVQWVISQAKYEAPPAKERDNQSTDFSVMKALFARNGAGNDEVEDRRKKLETANVLAVGRVSVQAPHVLRAKELARGVLKDFSASGTNANHFNERQIHPAKLNERINLAITPRLFPAQLNMSELVPVISWPIGAPYIAGLPQSRTRHMHVNNAVPTTGEGNTVVGASTDPGRARDVAIETIERMKHVHVIGPIGCLHPDTPIYDPLDNSTMTVFERFKQGKQFHVYAKDGDNIVIACASAPIEYHRARMVELYNDEHSIIVTPAHRVWDGKAYVEVEKLVRPDESATVQIPSISEYDLSRLHVDAQHLKRTHASSRDDYLPSSHSHGQPLRLATGGVRAVAQLQVDALSHNHGYLQMGAVAGEVERNRSYLSCDHPSTKGCTHQRSSCDARYRATSGTSTPTSSSHSCVGKSLDPYSLPGKGAHIRQSVQLSTSTYTGTPFNSYFKNNTFKARWVEDAVYYDFHVPRYQNYLAQGMIHHNSGKTALLTNMAEQDMAHGFGLVLIETKGDLFQAVLERVPAERLQDVIVWDLDDTDFPIGFNVLRQSSSRSAVDELNALIQAMYPESGLMTTGPLYHGVHALAESANGTFVDLPTMLSPSTDEEKQWRLDLVKGLKNREVKRYWERYFKNDPKRQDADSAPLQRRMWEFTSRAEIRNSLGQSDSSFYMEDVVRDGKILLVNLNGVRIGQKSASLIGTLIMNSVWNAVRTTHHERPVILYMDEFQNFVTMPTSPSDMLAQSRSFGLGMVLAHQHTGQLKADLRDAVLANARTKVVFQTTANDARVMASEFGRQVNAEDFMNLRHREAIARVATSTGVSAPFTMRTKDLSRPRSNPRHMREMSRERYGRPVEQVEIGIDARRNPAPKVPRDLSIGIRPM